MLKVRLYIDRLDCYLSGALVQSTPRGTVTPGRSRGHAIDYRHFIDSLKRKPQAFKGPLKGWHFATACFHVMRTAAPGSNWT
jgi:hypothetical protein